MSPFTLLNTAYKNLSPALKRMSWVLLLVTVAALASSVGVTATILGWRDGRIPNALGLEAAVKDLTAKTTKLAGTDTVKMEAIANRVAEKARDGIMADLDEREADARHNVLGPILEQMERQNTNISTLFVLVRDQGRDVRAMPAQMSTRFQQILEESRPPLTTEEMLRDVMRKQAQQDSILNSLSEPKRKRMTKAPTM